MDKPKKPRTTFRTHQEVCHVWMSQSQERGEAGASGIYFYKKTISSWHRTPIARIVDKNTILARPAGCIFGNRGYQVHRAINHNKYKVFTVRTVGLRTHCDPDSRLNHRTNISGYIEDIKRCYKSFWTAREQKSNCRRGNIATMKELRRYVRYFNLKMPSLKGISLCTKEAAEHLRLYHEKTSDRLYTEAHATNEKRNKLLPLMVIMEKRWMDGLTNQTGLPYTKGSDYDTRPSFSKIRVRVNPDNKNELETSNGASVPIKEARVLYKMIKAGKPVHGHKVGHYTVVKMNGDLTVGCTTITRPEIERVAELLKW